MYEVVFNLSDVFKGYISKTLVENGLMKNSNKSLHSKRLNIFPEIGSNETGR